MSEQTETSTPPIGDDPEGGKGRRRSSPTPDAPTKEDTSELLKDGSHRSSETGPPVGGSE